jgi:hypothetical protein
MLGGLYLWDFVGKNLRSRRLKFSRLANPCAFMSVVECDSAITRWHTVCSPISATLLQKIGFPGWPEPNLDWVSVLGGQFKEGGGLHQPPFSFSGCDRLGG